MHNIAQIIKKIFFSIIVLSIIALLITDYNYFNKNKTNASDNRVKILGNSIVPDENIINMISQKNHQKSIYNSIVNELKVINISNKEQVVIIDEDNIRFYDDDYYYMSSGKKISLSKNLIDKTLFPVLKDDLQNKKLYNRIIFLTNYMFDNYPDLYQQLKSINFSNDRKLSIELDTYETILIDQNKESVNNSNILKKIDILRSFNNQFYDSLEIKEIDLTWKDKVFIKSI